MSIDILYVAFNRLAFTQASFAALLANTDWTLVGTLYVHDDASEDGTAEYLGGECERLNEGRVAINAVFHDRKLGGPVAAMNWMLDQQSEADRFAKIDNDFVVCPGWLEETLRMMTLNPAVDIFGIQPNLGPALPGTDYRRRLEEARHIGGIGAMRKRAFEVCRPAPSGMNGYHGFTEFQCKHPEMLKAWIAPDLPCFGLDYLPFEPWRSLVTEYVAKGWQRRWPEYDSHATSYWQWWLDQQEAAA